MAGINWRERVPNPTGRPEKEMQLRLSMALTAAFKTIDEVIGILCATHSEVMLPDFDGQALQQMRDDLDQKLQTYIGQYDLNKARYRRLEEICQKHGLWYLIHGDGTVEISRRDDFKSEKVTFKGTGPGAVYAYVLSITGEE